jgi:predicted phage terminase large subunit-like protein
VFRAAGVGVGITGMGANLILIDDPIKNREEAESETFQEKVWDSYRDDLYTRQQPGCAIVLTMTRWHERDLAARILESDDGPNWHVVCMPAFAIDQEERDDWFKRYGRAEGQPDPLGREPGAALCPDWYPEEELEGLRSVLGSYGFSALFQQSPVPPGGGMFPAHWPILDALPPGSYSYVRYWDKAGTEGGGCYTAGVLMARSSEGRYYLLDIVRGQWSAGNREKIIKDTAERDGTGVNVWLEQEGGSGGKESAENTIIGLAGYYAQKESVTGDKETRARPFAAQAEIQNVYLIKAPWNQPFIDEAKVFPFGKYKDQVDAAGGAFNKLALVPR